MPDLRIPHLTVRKTNVLARTREPRAREFLEQPPEPRRISEFNRIRVVWWIAEVRVAPAI
jgi:hypothetical protein